MRVPLVDLGWQHQEVADEVAHGIQEVIDNASFIQVADFESAFADFIGVRHCVGVGSGTDALELSTRVLGLGPGDKVIVPANSFIASALAVLRAGAQVVLVDCDPDTYLMDMGQAASAIDRSVRAVMPVHLYGQIAPVDELPDLPDRVAVVEDAAQSQGATRHGRGSGSFGRIAGTSFYPGKNLGAYGDGGAVLTNDDNLAQQVRKLGNWGSAQKYHHPKAGFNSRLDTIQSVVLSAKLSRLAEWNELRSLAAKRYDQLLEGLDQVKPPEVLEGNHHVWHLYVIQVPDRDRILAGLHDAGVGAGVHYPVPMHLQGALASIGYGAGNFPVTESLAESIISLPIFPGITESQQDHVVHVLEKALTSR
jgi:dTDP-4-amino-4,6-dideoxygalactose transaminase